MARPKPLKISENQDDELLSVTVLKDTKKAVVGTQDGVLSIFSWGDWGDCTDRFPGHPSSIESIAKLDESTIATGSSDGLVRVVSILPNKLAGVIGAHDEGFPVEKIGLSRDGRWLGSCSHDCTVQFWDVEQFMSSNNGDDDDDDEDDAQDEDDNEEKSGNVKRKPGSDDEDSSDDSDDSDGNKKRKKKKRQKAKRGIGGLTPAKSFFADLD
ncbi:WD domain repeat-containing protein 55 [Quaeritorhiza haematococci]|nr:WD domain repeat-containing protein 55 [Quaeritorhiza haematococci]